MPGIARASSNTGSVGILRKSSSLHRLSEAIRFPWVQINSDHQLGALLFDIDHSDGLSLLDDLASRGCPRPWLVMNALSGRAHAILPLKTPVATHDQARKAPIQLADVAMRLMGHALRATILPPTSLIKSPWGLLENLQGKIKINAGDPKSALPAILEALQEIDLGLLWHTVAGDAPAELLSIVDALSNDYERDDKGRIIIPKSSARCWKGYNDVLLRPNSLGRNCTVFDSVRFWCYPKNEKDYALILERAYLVNGLLATPLPASEVQSIAKSIAAYMLKDLRKGRYVRGKLINLGRDSDLNVQLDIKQKQALAGQRTAELRKTVITDRIIMALSDLVQNDIHITTEVLAKAANVSARTIQRHLNTSISEHVLGDKRCPSGKPHLERFFLQFEESRVLRTAINQFNQDLLERIDYKVRKAALISLLGQLTLMQRQRGADPASLPEIAQEFELDSEVKAAVEGAMQAIKDARRRHLAKIKNHNAKIRLKYRRNDIQSIVLISDAITRQSQIENLARKCLEHCYTSHKESIKNLDFINAEKFRLGWKSIYASICQDYCMYMMLNQRLSPLPQLVRQPDAEVHSAKFAREILHWEKVILPQWRQDMEVAKEVWSEQCYWMEKIARDCPPPPISGITHGVPWTRPGRKNKIRTEIFWRKASDKFRETNPFAASLGRSSDDPLTKSPPN